MRRICRRANRQVWASSADSTLTRRFGGRKNGVSLVFVTSEGKEHTESATETVTIQDAPVTFRVTLLPTSSSTAVVSFEYAQGGEFHPIGQPFEPARHTWVGARLAPAGMPMNGGDDRGGWVDFGAVRVEAIETL